MCVVGTVCILLLIDPESNDLTHDVQRHHQTRPNAARPRLSGRGRQSSDHPFRTFGTRTSKTKVVLGYEQGYFGIYETTYLKKFRLLT